jgi:hypothetical protein
MSCSLVGGTGSGVADGDVDGPLEAVADGAGSPGEDVVVPDSGVGDPGIVGSADAALVGNAVGVADVQPPINDATARTDMAMMG